MGVKSEPKAMGRKRLKQLVFLTILALSQSLPTETQETYDHSVAATEELFDEEINVEELFHDLFISSRSARDLGVDEDDEEIADVTDNLKDEVSEDAAMLTDEEVTDEAKVMEVARFNSYMDAIYRRMNAALRAKMMDPMDINLEDKDKKSPKSKKRVSRDVQGEEDDDINDNPYKADEDEMEVEIEHRVGKTKIKQRVKRRRKRQNAKLKKKRKQRNKKKD